MAQVTRASRNPRLDGRRVGLIVPSVNTTIEPEFAWIAPGGISFHAARVMLRATTEEGLREMNAEVGAASLLLASISPDVVAYACTSGSFLEGPAGLRRRISDIADVVGCPVVATSAALLDALRALRIERVALATPYLDPINRIEQRFLKEHGIGVVGVEGLGLSGTAIREVKPEAVIDLALRADRPRAQALFISCTDFRALEVADELEQRLRKPVLTSNQVTLWAILRALGAPPAIAGFGRLLQS
jgi:maleate cis-trans isomerase